MSAVDIVKDVLIIVFLIGVLVLVTFLNSMGGWFVRVGTKFGVRHPTVSAITSAALVAGVGALAAWQALATLMTDGGLVMAAVLGFGVGLGGTALWTYTSNQEYYVNRGVWLGVFGFSIIMAGACVAVFLSLGQAGAGIREFSLALLAAGLVPLAGLMLVGWRRGMKDPDRREEMSRRAFSLMSGRKPRPNR